MKDTALKIGGVAGVVAGSVALFLSGAGEVMVTGIVGAVFVLMGIIMSLFSQKK